MRHRDQPTKAKALREWQALMESVKAEGGEGYDIPVLVHFKDEKTYEVMDKDIVEDEFYVRRPFKILRNLLDEPVTPEDLKEKPRGRRSQRNKTGDKTDKDGKPKRRRRGRRRRGGRRKPKDNKPKPE